MWPQPSPHYWDVARHYGANLSDTPDSPCGSLPSGWRRGCHWSSFGGKDENAAGYGRRREHGRRRQFAGSRSRRPRPPDGHTLLLGGSLPHVLEAILKSKPLYDPTKDLKPISNIANSAFAIPVHPSVQWPADCSRGRSLGPSHGDLWGWRESLADASFMYCLATRGASKFWTIR